jgi:hypothetical protein
VTDVLADAAGAVAETRPGGAIYPMFATPVARFAHPLADALNKELSVIVLARAEAAAKVLGYKRETLASLADWGDSVTGRLTRWVLTCARQVVAASLQASRLPQWA